MSKDLVEQLQAQHPVHGILGELFEPWGGKQRMLTWADENPSRYITLLFKTVPNMQPIAHVQGDVNLHVHNTLGPTALDGEFEDVSDTLSDAAQ